MKTIVLVDRAGHQNEIKKISQEWLSNLLIFLGIEEQLLQDSDMGSITDELFKNSIDVITYPDIGAISVSIGEELVGEWGGPTLTLKEDTDGSLYFEAEIEHWSVLDESEAGE